MYCSDNKIIFQWHPYFSITNLIILQFKGTLLQLLPIHLGFVGAVSIIESQGVYIIESLQL